MKVGIIGLPGSGKTTLFQLLTGESETPGYTGAANKPQLKRVLVHDQRLERLRDDFQPKKFTPAAVDLLDFPPVKREGQDRAGLADLLAPAREAHALLIVVRAFSSPGLPSARPAEDLDEVEGELILSDLELVERRLEKLEAKRRKPAFQEEEAKEIQILTRLKEHLESDKALASCELSQEEEKKLGGFGFLSAKPAVVVVSCDESGVVPEVVEDLRTRATHGMIVVPARNELEILQLPVEERDVFLAEYGVEEFHQQAIIEASYRAAGAISFFTAGEKEVRAWTIRQGDTAPQAAGAIHSDFERGFIRAEVVSYADYEKAGSVKAAKEKGTYRVEGKDYVVADGDVVEFRFSV